MCQYAFIVDITNLPEAVREPNYALKDFVRRMIKSLSEDSVISKEIFTLHNNVGYLFFYDGNCSIEDFIANIKIKKKSIVGKQSMCYIST